MKKSDYIFQHNQYSWSLEFTTTAYSCVTLIFLFRSEILYGREAVSKERRFQRKVVIRTEQREKESIQLPKLKGFEE